MLLVSIVDGNEKDTACLHKLLEEYFTKTGTAYSERVYKSGIDFIQSSESCDLVIMDMRLDKLDGLETARIMRKLGNGAQLIYVTRAAESAIRGYEVDALDYILKPATQAAINFAMDKAMKRMEHASSTSLALKLPNGTASLSSNDITYVEVFDHNLVFHTVKGEYNVRGRLSRVYEQLDQDRFIVCNRSFIVNLRYVSGIWNDHVMVGDTKIAISKSHRKEIAMRFSAYLNEKKS